jgi:hypothetical protein
MQRSVDNAEKEETTLLSKAKNSMVYKDIGNALDVKVKETLIKKTRSRKSTPGQHS